MEDLLAAVQPTQRGLATSPAHRAEIDAAVGEAMLRSLQGRAGAPWSSANMLNLAQLHLLCLSGSPGQGPAHAQQHVYNAVAFLGPTLSS